MQSFKIKNSSYNAQSVIVRVYVTIGNNKNTTIIQDYEKLVIRNFDESRALSYVFYHECRIMDNLFFVKLMQMYNAPTPCLKVFQHESRFDNREFHKSVSLEHTLKRSNMLSSNSIL